MQIFPSEFYIQSELQPAIIATELSPENTPEMTNTERNLATVKRLEEDGFKFSTFSHAEELESLPIGSAIFATDYSFVLTSRDEDESREVAEDEQAPGNPPFTKLPNEREVLERSPQVKLFYLGQPEGSTYINILEPDTDEHKVLDRIYLDPEETKDLHQRAQKVGQDFDTMASELVEQMFGDFPCEIVKKR